MQWCLLDYRLFLNFSGCFGAYMTTVFAVFVRWPWRTVFTLSCCVSIPQQRREAKCCAAGRTNPPLMNTYMNIICKLNQHVAAQLVAEQLRYEQPMVKHEWRGWCKHEFSALLGLMKWIFSLSNLSLLKSFHFLNHLLCPNFILHAVYMHVGLHPLIIGWKFASKILPWLKRLISKITQHLGWMKLTDGRNRVMVYQISRLPSSLLPI